MEDLQQVITTTASTLETMADGLLARSALVGKMAEACKAMGNAFPAKPGAQAQPPTALETSGTGKKRGRPKRDPAAPVRPMTAFMRYLTAVRKTEQFGQMAGTNKEKLANVAEMWKVLPQQYKQGYIQQERQDIQVYKVALDTYRKQQQPPSSSKGTTATTSAHGQPEEELPPTQDENEDFSEEDEPTEKQRGGTARNSAATSSGRGVAQPAGQGDEADADTEAEDEDGFVRRGKGSQGKKQKKEKKETKRPKRKHSTDSV